MARKAMTEEVLTEEQKAEVKSAWEDMKSIHLPKAPKGEDNFVIASVNGRAFKVMRGVDVDVPAPIYEVLKNAEAAAQAADDFSESKEFV